MSSRSDIAIVAASLIAAAVPYLVFTLEYGGPAPNTPAQIDLLRSGAETAGWSTEPRLGPVIYALVFLKNFLLEWMPSLRPRNDLQLALLILPSAELMLATAGAILSFRAILSDHGEIPDFIVAAGMLAAAATLAIHIAFSYQRHLLTGWMMDAYPRYYLPVIVIVPMAAVAFTNEIPSSRVRVRLLSFLIVAPIVFGLLGAPLG